MSFLKSLFSRQGGQGGVEAELSESKTDHLLQSSHKNSVFSATKKELSSTGQLEDWLLDSIYHGLSTQQWKTDIGDFLDINCHLFKEGSEESEEQHRVHEEYASRVKAKLSAILSDLELDENALNASMEAHCDNELYAELVKYLARIDRFDVFSKGMELRYNKLVIKIEVSKKESRDDVYLKRKEKREIARAIALSNKEHRQESDKENLDTNGESFENSEEDKDDEKIGEEKIEKEKIEEENRREVEGEDFSMAKKETEEDQQGDDFAVDKADSKEESDSNDFEEAKDEESADDKSKKSEEFSQAKGNSKDFEEDFGHNPADNKSSEENDPKDLQKNEDERNTGSEERLTETHHKSSSNFDEKSVEAEGKKSMGSIDQGVETLAARSDPEEVKENRHTISKEQISRQNSKVSVQKDDLSHFKSERSEPEKDLPASRASQASFQPEGLSLASQRRGIFVHVVANKDQSMHEKVARVQREFDKKAHELQRRAELLAQQRKRREASM